MKLLLKEGGIRDIKNLAKRYAKAKIYFHQDLDGVATALGMKGYLENNGIKVVDAEIIQYGDKEFTIKKPSATGDVMPVLVDFAHGKPFFKIWTDHHDTQAGEKDMSTSFRSARSNVESISQIVSPYDIFPSVDIMMISTVDSADYARFGITPDQVMDYIFRLDKEKGFMSNKILMSLVTNKLLLAYKNKPRFLERLVLESKPSLINIYLKIVEIAKEDGYTSPEIMRGHAKAYVETMKTSKNVTYDEEYGIIKQYGGGSLFKPGSYDRYVPFKNFPDANFFIIAWPLGLLQASCNPFKQERALKGVNLGDMAKEILENNREELENIIVTVDSMKYFAEGGKKNKGFTEESVGFTYYDLVSLYDDVVKGLKIEDLPIKLPEDYTQERWEKALIKIMDKPYSMLDGKQIKALKLMSISGWDIIQANSGGHECITNISGLSFLGKKGNPMLKKLQSEFYELLKSEIDLSKT